MNILNLIICFLLSILLISCNKSTDMNKEGQIIEDAKKDIREHNYKSGYKQLHDLADSGSSKACLLLARLYIDGVGVDKNPKEYIKFTKKAADLGDMIGITNLGSAYIVGNFVNRDVDKGVKLLKTASDSGIPEANYFLSSVYSKDELGKKDLERSLAYCKLAAEKGYAPAQALLGVKYAIGEGAAVNLEMAFGWLEKAANNGEEVEPIFSQVKIDLITAELETKNSPALLYERGKLYASLGDNKSAIRDFNDGCYSDNSNKYEQGESPACQAFFKLRMGETPSEMLNRAMPEISN